MSQVFGTFCGTSSRAISIFAGYIATLSETAWDSGTLGTVRPMPQRSAKRRKKSPTYAAGDQCQACVPGYGRGDGDGDGVGVGDGGGFGIFSALNLGSISSRIASV